MVDRRNTPVEDLIRSQLQSEGEFTDYRSSYFKLWMAVTTAEKNLSQALFATIITKLKLFHVVEKKMYHTRQTFEINCRFFNSTRSLTFDLRKMLLPKRLTLSNYSFYGQVLDMIMCSGSDL